MNGISREILVDTMFFILMVNEGQIESDVWSLCILNLSPEEEVFIQFMLPRGF